MPAVTKQRVTIPIGGMHCASCVKRVEDAVLGVEGVGRAQVNLATEKATVDFEPEVCTIQQLNSAIEAAGYEAKPVGLSEDAEEAARAQEERSLRARMIFAIGVGAVLMVLAQSMDIPGLEDVRRRYSSGRGGSSIELRSVRRVTGQRT